MPGTYAHDSAVSKLHDAVDISSATTTTGTGVNVGRPGMVRFKQTSGAITGTSVTVDTEIQVSDDDSTYFTIAKFDTLTDADDSETHYVTADVQHTYVRAVTVSAGTSPSIPDLTVTMEEKSYLRTKTDSA